MNILQFKIDNSIDFGTPILFDGKPHPMPEPWTAYLGIEENNVKALIVASLQTSEYRLWTSVPKAEVPETLNTKIEDGLYSLGFSVSDREAASYPTLETGFYIYKNKKKIPDFDGLANYFKNEHNIKNDDTYVCTYEDDFYRDLSKIELLSKIDVHTRQQAKGTHVDHFKKTVVARCFYPKNKFNPPDGFVNLKNGVLDIQNKKLLDHNPDYNFRYKLNHKYEPGATAPRFIEFLQFIFDDDMALVKLIGEIMGYTLIGGEPFKHKAFIFYGEGRNGKSTLLDVIKELLGEHSVSSVSMQRINEPFSMVRMDGKLANIVEESPGVINAEAFKNIVSGGYVSAARKHMDEFDLKIKARMFFACNDYPHFKDSSKGLKDRLTIIPFKKYIKSEDRNSKIKDELFPEMSGILNFALKGFERLTENNFQFTKSAAVDESVSEYLEETDSVVSWAAEVVKITTDVKDTVKVKSLYDHYKGHCIENNYSPCNNKTFGKRFKRYLVNNVPSNINPDDIYGRSGADRYIMMCQLNGQSEILF
jgi:putative DNA primase/helicase